jgi:hypothetical protein
MGHFIECLGEIQYDVSLYTIMKISASSCESISVSRVLQEDLHRLEKWEKAWGMEFHPGQCNSMSITTAISPFEHRYTLTGHILEDVKEAKYAGRSLMNIKNRRGPNTDLVVLH